MYSVRRSLQGFASVLFVATGLLQAGCALEEDSALEPEEESIVESAQEITGAYTVEFVEEVSSGNPGYHPVGFYRDSAAYGWMCNSGAPENVPDIIAQFHIPGAYANRSKLRIRGTNAFASAFIADPTATRVYSDDDIRACIGAGSVAWWSWVYGVEPVVKTSDMLMWW